MNAQTQTANPARRTFTRTLTRTLIACVALSLAPAACMAEGEEDLDLMEMEDELDEETNEFGVQPPVFVPQPMTPPDRDRLSELGVDRIGDAWYDECNPCILTEEGPACLENNCMSDDVKPAVVSCEGGLYDEGDVWEDDCNLCMCTAQGTACTLNSCGEYDER